MPSVRTSVIVEHSCVGCANGTCDKDRQVFQKAKPEGFGFSTINPDWYSLARAAAAAEERVKEYLRQTG